MAGCCGRMDRSAHPAPTRRERRRPCDIMNMYQASRHFSVVVLVRAPTLRARVHCGTGSADGARVVSRSLACGVCMRARAETDRTRCTSSRRRTRMSASSAASVVSSRRTRERASGERRERLLRVQSCARDCAMIVWTCAACGLETEGADESRRALCRDYSIPRPPSATRAPSPADAAVGAGVAIDATCTKTVAVSLSVCARCLKRSGVPFSILRSDSRGSAGAHEARRAVVAWSTMGWV